MIQPALLPFAAVAWIDLLHRIIDGADDLASRGYLYEPDDPDECVVQALSEVAAELATLVAGCELCRIGPSALGDHWLQLQQQKWQQDQPTWTCACGAVYKTVGEPGNDQEFYNVGDDGLFGRQAGVIKVSSKRKVTHSDACPACGRSFDAMVSLQNRLPMRRSQPAENTSASAADDPAETLF